jgi:hypothetical protein
VWWRDRPEEGGYREQLIVNSRSIQVVRREEPAGARFHAGCLATWDRRGRVRVTELQYGEVVVELRR